MTTRNWIEDAVCARSDPEDRQRMKREAEVSAA